ncbi:MAG: heavy metal translocating P-type ATPase [Desulfovibrio sp.]|uniref:heavy metal translocating P-type ATPase n=1 Tax=Desulfovibrio sp. 7SRBS1 TaxID=3378064 RepID=UPI003B3F15F9
MTRHPAQQSKNKFTIVHSLPHRLRLRCNLLHDPALDVDYLSALIESQPGVQNVRINRLASSIIIEFTQAHSGQNNTEALHNQILHTLNTLPGEAFLPDPERESGPDIMDVAGHIAAAAATPALPLPVKAGVSWFLALPTLVDGVRTLIERGLKIEVLDGTAKLFALLRGDYFTSNTVGALLKLGAYVEHSTENKTNDLLKNLLQPQVEEVRILRDEVESKIPFEQTSVGDQVVCGPGELVPVDGDVMRGEASINMSSVTGESVPVHIKPGDSVLSGGVIEDGRIVVRAEMVGSETSMARISNYLKKSLRDKSTSQRQTEALADKLVPLTFGAGLGIYALTGDASRAASVLTVDYSCAIKLATPVAVRSAMYVAGREGVILKGASALDSLARVDTVLFDKTGTLTKGQLAVTDVIPLHGMTENDFLSMAAGAEEHYAHPVAHAVVAEARKRKLPLPEASQVDFVVAHGVSAYVRDVRVLVGSRHFIHDDEQIDCSSADEQTDKLLGDGKSLLYVACNNQLAGIIGVRDELRHEARDMLRQLKTMGITRLVVLTGDHQRTAEALWAQLPELDEVHSELKPEDKARILKGFQNQGHKVAFVGDGVNDAPALLSADVGICMPSGADLARESAQVILMTEDIGGLALARAVSQKVESTLRHCLWSAVSINSLILAFASAGKLPAITAAALHNGSTIGILGYAAMRNRSTPQPKKPQPPKKTCAPIPSDDIDFSLAPITTGIEGVAPHAHVVG